MGISIIKTTRSHDRFIETGLFCIAYSDVMMSAIASQITGVSIVCSTVCSSADQRKHQSSASPDFGRGGTTGGFPSQRARNAETVSIWWRHYGRGCWSSGNSRSIDSHNFDLVIPECFGLITTVVNSLGLTVYIPTQSLNHITINHTGCALVEENVVICIGGYLSPSASPVVHYDDVMMSAMASKITSLTIVYSTVYSGTDERKLAFVRGIHWWPVNSRTKGQKRGQCFHLMTSSWVTMAAVYLINWCKSFHINRSRESNLDTTKYIHMERGSVQAACRNVCFEDSAF